jgi:hypothetical protein
MDAGKGGSGSLATTSAASVRPRAAARGTVSALSGSVYSSTVACGQSDRDVCPFVTVDTGFPLFTVLVNDASDILVRVF